LTVGAYKEGALNIIDQSKKDVKGEKNVTERYYTEFGETERTLSALLPYRLVSAAIKCAAANHGVINELRLRVGQPLAVTSDGKNLISSLYVTKEDIDHTVRRLCSNSLYSHADTIKEGYITSREGIRAGICGKAVTDGGIITAVTDVSSLSLRFPRRVTGAADTAYELLKARDFATGILVYSKPGVGKTTLLRELALRLSSGETPLRLAVVDTRCELSATLGEATMADILLSYPRGKGIEIAVRTLSPQYVICDEIGSGAEAEAILDASHSGVSFAASAHGGSFDELMRSRYIRTLWEAGIFGIGLGLLDRRKDGSYVTEISCFEDLSAERETVST